MTILSSSPPSARGMGDEGRKRRISERDNGRLYEKQAIVSVAEGKRGFSRLIQDALERKERSL